MMFQSAEHLKSWRVYQNPAFVYLHILETSLFGVSILDGWVQIVPLQVRGRVHADSRKVLEAFPAAYHTGPS